VQASRDDKAQLAAIRILVKSWEMSSTSVPLGLLHELTG
jgi:hypothetical protein